MRHLIDSITQNEIASSIDRAVQSVLRGWTSHGNEEGLTAALGQELMSQSFSANGLRVRFNYRQLNKQTEENNAGADGGFLVMVSTPSGSVKKAAMFQAKKLAGGGPVRDLSLDTSESNRLIGQVGKMLGNTDESVAVFYTRDEIYVVDASRFDVGAVNQPMKPLSDNHRLITLGTYLGKWLPRCTRGDRSTGLISRVEHLDGFRKGISMEVISQRPTIDWGSDPVEKSWKDGRRRS